jgi:hypothetical protein
MAAALGSEKEPEKGKEKDKEDEDGGRGRWGGRLGRSRMKQK